MFYKKRVIVLLLLVITIVISGCGIIQKKSDDAPTDQDNYELEEEDVQEEDEDTRETILFYQDDAGYLVPIMRKIEWEEGIAKAALSKLIDTPDQQQEILGMGLKPLLSANAQINGISINDGLAKVDFNQAAMEYADATTENNMVQGVVMTLTHFPAIDRVQLMFEGQILDTLKHGTKVGEPIEPKYINPELSPDSTAEGAEVTVFFHNTSSSRYEYLVPITRITSSPSASIETAMEELLKGPKADGGLQFAIPSETKLLGVHMDDGITYINFSKEFDSLQGSESQDTVLKAITMTAKEFPGVSMVKVLVEGEEYEGNELVTTPVFANEY